LSSPCYGGATGDRGFESISLQRGVCCEPRSRRSARASVGRDRFGEMPFATLHHSPAYDAVVPVTTATLTPVRYRANPTPSIRLSLGNRRSPCYRKQGGLPTSKSSQLAGTEREGPESGRVRRSSPSQGSYTPAPRTAGMRKEAAFSASHSPGSR
jgi:hypothetical protein